MNYYSLYREYQRREEQIRQQQEFRETQEPVKKLHPPADTLPERKVELTLTPKAIAKFTNF